MTTIGDDEKQKHRNLTCVDIVKDAVGANPDEINEAKNQLVISKCTNILSLTLIKQAITDKFAKLNTTISNLGNKQTKIPSNIDYFFVDAAWGLYRIKKNINNNKVFKICATPATFTDPASRPPAEIYIDINNKFDLEQYGLNGSLTYNSNFLDTSNSISVNLKPINGTPYFPIDCNVNIKGSISNISESALFLNTHTLYKSIFHGNPKKKQFINTLPSQAQDKKLQKLRNLFVICKEIGDLMQAVCLEYLIKQPNSFLFNPNSALLTNDAVLAARSMLCNIPYIVSHTSGLIKYYIPGDPSEINKYYIQNYYENFINNNISVSNNLYLFNESEISNLKIKGDNSKFESTPLLQILVSKIKNIILKTSIIFSKDFEKFIYDNINVSSENNLKIFKLFFQSLSIPNIIYKLSDVPSKKKNQSNISLINSNYRKIFSTSFIKNSIDKIQLNDNSYSHLHEFINNYFQKNIENIKNDLQLPNFDINLFYEKIIKNGNIQTILSNDEIGNIFDDDKKPSDNLDLTTFLKRFAGPLSKKRKSRGGSSKKIKKSKNKKKTKKIKKIKKYKKTKYSKKNNIKYKKKSKKIKGGGADNKRQNLEETEEERNLKRKKAQEEQEENPEKITEEKYDSFDKYCELYQYIYINPYLYYYFITKPGALKEFMDKMFDPTYIQKDIYDLITITDDRLLDEQFEDSNESEITNNTFINNDSILKKNISRDIEYDDIDEYKAETITTIKLLEAIQMSPIGPLPVEDVEMAQATLLDSNSKSEDSGQQKQQSPQQVLTLQPFPEYYNEMEI
tara:strand:- start:2788 stop:5169 length:2382 start_codon:yes stop_codon:yes gene_type:complete